MKSLVLSLFVVSGAAAASEPKFTYRQCVQFEPDTYAAIQLKFYNKKPVGTISELLAIDGQFLYYVRVWVVESVFTSNAKSYIFTVPEDKLTAIECPK